MILKNINKHIDMKNLQIIKNFGIKLSNVARLFDHAFNGFECFKSFDMFDFADHRNN